MEEAAYLLVLKDPAGPEQHKSKDPADQNLAQQLHLRDHTTAADPKQRKIIQTIIRCPLGSY